MLYVPLDFENNLIILKNKQKCRSKKIESENSNSECAKWFESHCLTWSFNFQLQFDALIFTMHQEQFMAYIKVISKISDQRHSQKFCLKCSTNAIQVFHGTLQECTSQPVTYQFRWFRRSLPLSGYQIFSEASSSQEQFVLPPIKWRKSIYQLLHVFQEYKSFTVKIGLLYKCSIACAVSPLYRYLRDLTRWVVVWSFQENKSWVNFFWTQVNIGTQKISDSFLTNQIKSSFVLVELMKFNQKFYTL